ncbi:MAG: IS701 family transposase [Polyangiales bacterium]
MPTQVPPSQFGFAMYAQFLALNHGRVCFTDLARVVEGLSHDRINRYMRNHKLTSRAVWRAVRGDIVPSKNAYILFDDTVLSKKHARHNQLVRRQWSGNEKKVVDGIGLVTCVYVNPEINRFWIVDFRIFQPDHDGKSKHQHAHEMLENFVHTKPAPVRRVLVDSWYATKAFFLLAEKLGLIYYAPIKSNRQVRRQAADDHQDQRVDSVPWDAGSLEHGHRIHLRGMPKGHTVKLFRVVVLTDRIDWVITNDPDIHLTTETVRKHIRVRWKVEQFHREMKQMTSVEKCQAIIQRIQRNHIACAIVAWIFLNRIATHIGKTAYSFKRSLLDGLMRQMMKTPKDSFLKNKHYFFPELNSAQVLIC